MKKKITMIVTIVMMVATLVPSVVFADAELPNAYVNDMGAQTITEYGIYDGHGFVEGNGPIELQIALEFIAKDTPEQAANNYYKDHTTDFYITLSGFEGKIKLDDDCYLAGNYGTFGWIKVPVGGMEIESGKPYPVITSVGLDFSYKDICTNVKKFKCGIHFSDKILEENPNIKVQLDLGLSESIEKAQEANFTPVDEPFVYDKYDLTGEERPAPPTTQEQQKSPDKSPNTGDNTVAPFAVAGLVLAAMAAAVVARRRYN